MYFLTYLLFDTKLEGFFFLEMCLFCHCSFWFEMFFIRDSLLTYCCSNFILKL
jgi:hypothetical protein